MIVPVRRSLLAATAVLLALAVSACSNTVSSEAGAVSTGGGEPATIAIETSNMYVTVRNNAGVPLENVRVAVQPVGSPLAFTHTLRRMENGEARDISLGTFRGNDGTTFSPRVYKPKQVTVTATDIVGKTHERTLAWGR